MATVARPRPTVAWARSVAQTPAAQVVAFLLLIGLSLLLRTTQMGTDFWLDEGLSVGIADRPLLDIPGVMLQDGSPPLYYMAMHVWIALFGNGVETAHWFSVVFALACIPAAFWVGWSVFDRGTAWILAVLTALCPFLTAYAQEARMYSMVAFFAIIALGCFLNAYLRGRRVYVVPFGVSLALLLYTHNWGLFLGVGFAVAAAIMWTAIPRADGPTRRGFLRDALLGFGLTAVLWLPWVPSFLSQVRHTGAPWSDVPSFASLLHAPDLVLGGFEGTVALLLAAGAGIAALWRTDRFDRRVVVPSLLVLAVVPIVLPWLASQVSPAWATRYLAIAVGPLLLLGAVGLRRAGAIGVAGLVLVCLMWASFDAPSAKSNVAEVAEELGPGLRPGDLVVATQPEMVPVLSYYLPDDEGLTFLTPLGVAPDTGVTDWRDGVERFDATGVGEQLVPALDALPVGAQVLFVRPIIWSDARWSAPWTSRIRDESIEYEGVMRGDQRFELDAIVPAQVRTPGPNPAQGFLFRKVRD